MESLTMNDIKNTQKLYGFLWTKDKEISLPNKWHFNSMQEVINEPIVRGLMGIDIGSGCGYDTYIMARNNPLVKIVSIDISDGIYETKKLTVGLENIILIKCSVLDIPIKENVFDFAYSFGTLHHILDPQKGLLEMFRVLKKNSPVFLYLYEDHSENIIKYIAVNIIAKLRKITVRIPTNILYRLSYIVSPIVYILFTIPSRILAKFKVTQNFAMRIPFNSGKGFFSLCEDLYDRFGAPIEYRFSKQEVYSMFKQCGFWNISITRLNNSAGWVVRGYKK